MLDFEFQNVTKVYFGDWSYTKILEELNKYNVKNLLVLCSGDYIKTLGIFSEIEKICKEDSIKYYLESGVVPNPELDYVMSIIGKYRGKSIDMILAVGGGSVIDTAKAVALGYLYEGDVWDYFVSNPVIGNVLPVGVISTIPSSGSETSNAIIITKGSSKKGFEDDKIVPKFVLLNPLYTRTLPTYQMCCGISDILSHLVERYLTNVKSVDTTDFLIEGAIQALILNGNRFIENTDNTDVRREIQWLATIGHNNFMDVGREADWASHRIEHELSGEYKIVHGEGMAVVLLAYLKYIAKVHPIKSAQLAKRILKLEDNDLSERELTFKLIDYFYDFYKKLGLRTSLKEFDITDDKFELMSMRATNNDTSTVGHYYPLDSAKFIEVLQLAL